MRFTSCSNGGALSAEVGLEVAALPAEHIEPLLETVGRGLITTLELAGCGVGDRGAAAVAAGLRANKGLTSIDLGRNAIGPAGAQVIATVPMVATFHDTFLALHSHSVLQQALAEALVVGGANLLELELYTNLITDIGACALAAALPAATALATLNLTRNGLTDRAAAALAAAAAASPSLLSLSLGYNRITDDGARSFAELFVGTPSAQSPWLPDHLPVLKVLSLYANSISAVGEAELRRAVATTRLPEAGPNAVAIELIDVSSNNPPVAAG